MGTARLVGSSMRLMGSTVAILTLSIGCTDMSTEMAGQSSMEQRSEYERAIWPGIAAIPIVHQTTCGPFQINIRATNSVSQSELQQFGPLVVDGKFMGSVVRVIEASATVETLQGLLSSTPTQPENDFRVFRSNGDTEREVAMSETISLPPEGNIDFGDASLVDGISHRDWGWNSFIPANASPGLYKIRFARAERLQWEGGRCEFDWPQLVVRVTAG